MTPKETLKAKRAAIVERLKKHPKGAALLASREKKEEKGTDLYLEAIKQVSELTGKLVAHIEGIEEKSEERIASISKSFATEVARVEKTLKALGEASRDEAVLQEFKEVKLALRALANKQIPAPQVTVKAPEVHVTAPEPKVINETKTEVLHETKYQEQAAKTLDRLVGLLQKVAENTSGKQSVMVLNRALNEAIPVQLVDKRGKHIMDLSDMGQYLMATQSGGNLEVAGTRSDPVWVAIGPPTTALTPSAPANATVGTTSAQALASNTSRKGLHLVNTSPSIIYLGLGTTAELLKGIPVMPNGGTWEMSDRYLYTGAINAIATGSNANLAIQEWT